MFLHVVEAAFDSLLDCFLGELDERSEETLGGKVSGNAPRPWWGVLARQRVGCVAEGSQAWEGRQERAKDTSRRLASKRQPLVATSHAKSWCCSTCEARPFTRPFSSYERSTDRPAKRVLISHARSLPFAAGLSRCCTEHACALREHACCSSKPSLAAHAFLEAALAAQQRAEAVLRRRLRPFQTPEACH